jgi:hypothetical protein
MAPIYLLIWSVVALALFLVARTVHIMRRFRRLAAEQKQKINAHLAERLSLSQSIATVLSELNRARSLGLTSATIDAASTRLADLSSKMDLDNVVDILAQFTQRYLLLETRTSRPAARTLNNSKVLYAAEHLDLQERNGYFLIRPSTQADFATKYSDVS